MDGDDPYDVLQVSRAATVAEIRKSYQNLARKVYYRSSLGSCKKNGTNVYGTGD